MSSVLSDAPGVDQSAQPNKTGRSKPRARLVCANCRSRKVKCDAEKLAAGKSCSHCESSGLQCVLNQTDRRRRGRPSRQATDALQDQIASLKSALKEANQMNQSLSCGRQEVSDATRISPLWNDHDLGNSPSSLELSPQMPGQPPISARGEPVTSIRERPLCLIEEQPEMTEDNGSFSQAVPSTNECSHAQSRGSFLSTNHERWPEGVNSNTATRDVPTLSQEFEKAGDIVYYGPTTQLHVQSPSDGILTNGPEDDIAPSMPLNMNSSPLRQALIELYFKLQTRFQVLINERLFRSDRALQKRSQYYSSFLEDAILAFAARHSSSSAVRKLKDEFASRSKKQIAMELDDPKISSLQALLLLGDFEATRGRARVGWTYCVIACGLMVDLGIHFDCSHLVKRGKLTAEEANAREDLLLSVFVYAAQWSLYLGRPNPISPITFRATQKATAKGPNAWVFLCSRMLEIMEILNGPASLSAFTCDTADRLLNLNSGLRSFVEAMQPSLSNEMIESGELGAELYSFHMQCCGLQILLIRAILKSDQPPQQLDGIPTPRILSEMAREQLYERVKDNALRIGQLIASYDRIFGVGEIVTVMIDNIFIAAVALISHAHRQIQKGQNIDQTTQWLKFLCRTIQAMRQHFAATSRMLSCLSKLVEGSSMASIFPPPSSSSVTNSTHEGFDILSTHRGHSEISGINLSGVSVETSTFDSSHLLDEVGNGHLPFGAFWNMMPTIFEPMSDSV